jgi:hypothetical protein
LENQSSEILNHPFLFIPPKTFQTDGYSFHTVDRPYIHTCPTPYTLMLIKSSFLLTTCYTPIPTPTSSLITSIVLFFHLVSFHSLVSLIHSLSCCCLVALPMLTMWVCRYGWLVLCLCFPNVLLCLYASMLLCCYVIIPYALITLSLYILMLLCFYAFMNRHI